MNLRQRLNKIEAETSARASDFDTIVNSPALSGFTNEELAAIANSHADPDLLRRFDEAVKSV